jgi:predicted transposase YbfD/YdcC
LPKKTLEIATERGATFITQVKANQKGLLNQIRLKTTQLACCDVYQDKAEKGHGRIEERCYEVFDADPMLKKWPEWNDVTHIIRVTRQRDVFKRTLQSYESTKTVSYYISNKKLKSHEYSVYIRKHWFIENKLHHVKDVAFLEDKHRKEKMSDRFSMCIDISLNILRKNKVENIKGALYQNSMSVYKMLSCFEKLVC